MLIVLLTLSVRKKATFLELLISFSYLLKQVYCLIRFANGRIDSDLDSQPMKKPSKSVVSRVSFCPMDYLHHFAYDYCNAHFCAFQVCRKIIIIPD